MINQAIKNLVEYGISSELITTEDRIYTTNRLLEILGIDDYSEPEAVTSADLETILADFIAYGVENGLLEDSITAKDLFDTIPCLRPIACDNADKDIEHTFKHLPTALEYRNNSVPD